MSSAEVTREGLAGVRPDTDAMAGVRPARRGGRRGGRGERAMVPPANFTSYYGKPVINQPVWSAPDIPGYFFLGGLAGASSMLAAGAELTERPGLARVGRIGAVVAIGGGLVGLVHDLGKPSRFINMLRVCKPTSPMSIGTWVLSVYTPMAGAAAVSDVFGVAACLGRLAGKLAAVLGPVVASYTAVLIADTAVPAWHEGYPELPFVFVGSAAASAGGLGLLAAPLRESGPACWFGVLGGLTELAALQRMDSRLELVGEPYSKGKAGLLGKISKGLTLGGLFAAGLGGRRHRAVAVAAGAALLAGGAVERFAVFQAGMQSANDPKYTVVPQRQRLEERDAAGSG